MKYWVEFRAGFLRLAGLTISYLLMGHSRINMLKVSQTKSSKKMQLVSTKNYRARSGQP
jgi:hypothetical protein